MVAPAVVPRIASRVVYLDKFRGSAVLLMLLDHLVLILHGPQSIRLTVTRLAMPAFFILAGHLAGRLSWRHAWICLAGAVLPLVVPWVDAPNVLVLWSLGCVLLFGLRRFRVPVWVLPLVGLTFAANGFGVRGPNSYEFTAMWGLMGLGVMIPRGAFAFAAALPALVASIGRHPVAWYLGHLLVLQGVIFLGGLT